jgi:hypothetical protein
LKILQLVIKALETDKKRNKKKINFANMINNQLDATSALTGKLTTSSTLFTQSEDDCSLSLSSSSELDASAVVLDQANRKHLYVSNSY